MSGCLLVADPTACNPIDVAVIRRVKKLPFLRFINKRTSCWEHRLRKAILMYSDQQLIAGLALLISAYTQLKANISAYHWQLVVYLAWFSSFTHLSTLTILRHLFRSNTSVRNLRLFLMLFNLILLTFALVPTAYDDWMVNFPDDTPNTRFSGAIYAQCFFTGTGNTTYKPQFDMVYQGLTFIISIIILVIGSLSRAIRLSPNGSHIARDWLCEKPSRLLQKKMQSSLTNVGSKKADNWASKTNYCLLSILALVFKCFFELYTSMLWEVSESIIQQSYMFNLILK